MLEWSGRAFLPSQPVGSEHLFAASEAVSDGASTVQRSDLRALSVCVLSRCLSSEWAASVPFQNLHLACTKGGKHMDRHEPMTEPET